jgi:hypothetical protein
MPVRVPVLTPMKTHLWFQVGILGGDLDKSKEDRDSEAVTAEACMYSCIERDQTKLNFPVAGLNHELPQIVAIQDEGSEELRIDYCMWFSHPFRNKLN